MQFGQPKSPERRALTPGLKKQMMFQAILLVMASGLIYTLWHNVDEQDRRIRTQAEPNLEGVPVVPGFDGEESLDDVGLAELSDPEPWVENLELLAKAAVLEAKGELDSESIVHLMQKARVNKDGLESEKPALSEIRGELVWQQLQDLPHKFRGHLVEVRGNVVAGVKSPAIRLDGEVDLPIPNPAGVPEIYRTYVYGEDGRIYVVNLCEPPAKDLSHMDGVRFRGYFSQLYTYDVIFDGKSQRAKIPLLVGNNLVHIPGPKLEAPDMRPLYVIVIALPLIAGLVIFIVSIKPSRPRKRQPRP